MRAGTRKRLGRSRALPDSGPHVRGAVIRTTVPLNQGGGIPAGGARDSETEGPFAFALDTGASRTIVDRRIAEGLGLPVVGDEVQVSGVGGNTLAQPVRVDRWRLAGIDLPASTLDALELSDGDHLAGLQGLFGSDTLSKFEVIQLDYKHQRLIFHTGPSGHLAARP